MALIYSKADKKAIDNAVAKARQVKPRVRPLEFGWFEVQGSDKAHTVEFTKNEAGEFLVNCTCQANQKGSKPCYHAAAASGAYKLQVKNRAAEKAALEVLEAPAPEPTCYCSECGTEHLASLNICPSCGFNYITRQKPERCYRKFCTSAAEQDGLCSDHLLELAANYSDLFGGH